SFHLPRPLLPKGAPCSHRGVVTGKWPSCWPCYEFAGSRHHISIEDRRPNEPIAQFLVREALGFEEFQEALLQLKEERDGLDPSQRQFDLPEITGLSAGSSGAPAQDHEPWWNGRWGEWRGVIHGDDEDDDEPVQGDAGPSQRPDGYAEVPQTSDPGSPVIGPSEQARRQNMDGSPTQSPSRKVATHRKPHGAEDVLSPMDSFILDVMRGVGKHLSQAELDAYLLKGKGKGKFKGLHAVSWDDGWYGDSYENYGMFKGKGKYGKNVKGKYKPSLNTYVMDYDYHSAYCLELFPLELLSTSQPSTTGPQRSVPLGFGMLDCGATASAGPESSAKLLISKLREIDPQIGVHLDDSRRPYFRYGSGQWGQSLYHLTLVSAKNPARTFEMYTLPDPDGFVYGWSSPSQLVPILVGMDHLQKIGLVLDFSDGFALHGAEPEAEPYCLHKNPKGHFMIDLVYYLCGVISDAEAIDTFAATMDGASPQSSGQGSWPWLELGPMELMAVSHAQASDSQHASKSVAAPKSPSLPLEHDRALPADPRDPRSQSTWPCNGSHEHKTNGGNASGTWSDCATCGLRLSYIPRQGTPAKYMTQNAPEVITNALKMLKEHLTEDQKPNASMVKTCIRLVESSMAMEARKAKLTLMEAHHQSLKAHLQLLLAAPVTQLCEEDQNEAQSLLSMLTGDEIARLREIAAERVQVFPMSPPDSEDDHEPEDASLAEDFELLHFVESKMIGLRASRINLHQGYDLYQPSTYDEYDLRSQLGLLLQKRWTIATSSNSFFQTYRNKTCVGNHDHDYVQGLETSRSAYYPWKMCKSIAQHWRRELYPEKWLHRLHSPLPLHLNMAEQEHTLRLDLMPQMLQDEQPSAQDLRTWQLQLLKYHKVIHVVREYGINQQQTESAQEVLDGLYQCWLKDKPKMKILVPDNALTMRGDLMRSFLSDVGIQLEVPPVKESWSHGIMERCVQEIKTVASKLTLSHPEMSVQNVLALTTMALNSTETVHPAQWQSLADMIPNRSYIDVTNEEPDENEEEGPHLPLQPDADTMKMPEYVPKTRHTTKSGLKWHQVLLPPAEPMPSILEELPPVPPDTALDENDVVPSPSTPADDPLNDYGDPTYVPDSDEDVGNTGIGSGRGDSDAPDDGLSQQQPLLQSRASSDKSPPSNEPESKRQRVEDEEQALYNCFMEVEECYMLSVELDVTSQRQKQQFVKHPSLFLAQKMRDCEVRLTRLKPEHRELFDRAKTKVLPFAAAIVAQRGPLQPLWRCDRKMAVVLALL
ncbi:unnamed protein product, partial [Cladocopium goreaui]